MNGKTKNNKKYLISFSVSVILFLLVVLCLCSCNKNNNSDLENNSNSVIVDDIYGNTQKFDTPLNKIIATHISVLNYVVALGAQDKLCAISDGYKNEDLYKKVVPNWNNLLRVSYGKKLYPEQAIKSNAQLVILPERYNSTVSDWEKINISTFVALPDIESFDNNSAACLRIGKLLGKQENSQILVDYYNEIINSCKNTKTDTKILFLGTEKLSAYHKGMIQDDIITAAGGVNAIDSNSPEGSTFKLDYETIISSNPDQIWIPSYASYNVSDILNDSKLSTINAIKNGKIFMMPCKLDPWDYPTMSSCLGVAWAYSKINGEENLKYPLDTIVDKFYKYEYSKNAQELGIEY